MNKIVATIYTSKENAVLFKKLANEKGWLVAEERYAGEDALLEFEAINPEDDDIYRLSNTL